MLTKAQRLEALDREFDSPENRQRGHMKLAEFLSRRDEIQREPEPKRSKLAAALDELLDSVKAYVERKMKPLEDQVRGSTQRLDKQHERIAALEEKVAALEEKVAALEEKVAALEEKAGG